MCDLLFVKSENRLQQIFLIKHLRAQYLIRCPTLQHTPFCGCEFTCCKPLAHTHTLAQAHRHIFDNLKLSLSTFAHLHTQRQKVRQSLRVFRVFCGFGNARCVLRSNCRGWNWLKIETFSASFLSVGLSSKDEKKKKSNFNPVKPEP